MKTNAAFRPKLITIAGSLVLFATIGTASAEDVQRLANADANGDGKIEWQEMLDTRATVFARLDRNGDGFADNKDKPSVGPAKRRYEEALANFKNADANGDGRIARNEMIDAPAPLFEKGDANGDNALSADEIAVLRADNARP